VRLERNQIETRNNPFTGGTSFDNTPTIFPSKYLFLDRLDNAARGETTPPRGTTVTFNDQILGIPVPIDPVTGFVDLKSREEIQAAVNGSIDEILILPQVGLTYRPIAGLNLRGAFSKSAARPSFRELGYYVTVRPGVDELIVGNPKLQLSPVLSGDLRSEYTWGDFGDLAALSVFYKEIDRPIEAFILRDPANIEAEASFRTYRNNPNQAKMIGIELEARKNLEFLGLDFLEFFTIGANATYIHARVERNETELERSREFFADVPPIDATFPRLLKRRRLYGQPEWIANGDLTFDQEDWGTKITLSAFAISSVLDAAGSGATSPRGTVTQLKLDRYIDTYYQLDLVASQTWYVPLLRGDLTAKVSIKNLSDSTRRWVYDREQTAERVSERSYKVGRRYSFSLGYTF
jgi:outer membrane receptor protein involved in Fe transport